MRSLDVHRMAWVAMTTPPLRISMRDIVKAVLISVGPFMKHVLYDNKP